LPSDAINYGDGFHVGISWRGSPSQSNDSFRSTSLAQWNEVLAVEGVTFHSLQADNSEEALLYPSIKNCEKPSGWLETARKIAGLDLVVSVDTSIVHLAGAMGIPCFCAMHSRPYFVYPPKFGEVTPWYKSVKLFRSRKENDWHFVFDNITNELKRLVK
jgi:ADP-heptose:LPS heptosyltransferase